MKNSVLLPIFLIVAVDVLGLAIVLPLLPFYAEKYGATPAVVGLLSTVFAFCQLLSGPLLGRLSDRTGRKPLLIVSQIGTFIGFIILGVANQLWLIFVSRIIDGITAGNISLAQAYISDVTAPQNRARAFALIGIAFGMGFLVGPAISGYLSQFGYHYPALAAAALSFTSILATTFLLPARPKLWSEEAAEAQPKKHTEWKILDLEAYAKFFRKPGLATLLVQFFLFAMAFAMSIAGLALFCERRFFHDGHPFGPREVGYVFAFNGLIALIVQGGLVGRLVKRFGEARLVALGFLGMAVGFGGLSLADSIGVLLACMLFQTFGHSTLRPALTSLITQRADRHEQGAVLGLNQSLMSVAQIVGPILAGLLIDRDWLVAWALGMGGFAALGLLLALGLRKSHSGKIASAH